MFMKENDWVLIHMPSGNVKLSKMMKDGILNMGKFGSFPVNKLVGCPYGHSYEVVDKDHIRPVLPSELEEVDETAANNREITNDGFAQKLSVEEIEKLKDEGLKGAVSSDAIIKAMVENHAEFDKKTEYSKAKYIKKKKTKFSKIFTPVRPRIATICEYYFTKNPQKIREIRIDTLSQMLNLANIQAGGRYLVVDNTQGLIVSSLLERMGGSGLVLAIHEGDMPNLDIVKYMNFPDEIVDCMQYLRWGAVPKEAESVLEHHTPKSMDAETLRHHQRRVAAHERRLHVQQLLWEGNFDGLIIASQYSHESILDVLTPFIGGSRPVVIYSQYRELLNESKESMRNSQDWINPSVTESFLREYQVLPGRTHPTMQTSGSGGALLTATRVLGDTNITGIARSTKNAWGKRVRL